MESWLDAGGGTGHLVQIALPLFPNARFILSDSSEAMLHQARKRLADQPQDRVEFLRPVRNEQLDLVANRITPQVVTSILCNHYLHTEQRYEAVRACHQVLQPGGIFVTFERLTPAAKGGAQIGLERWRRYQLEQGRSLPTVEEHMMRFKTKISHYDWRTSEAPGENRRSRRLKSSGSRICRPGSTQ